MAQSRLPGLAGQRERCCPHIPVFGKSSRTAARSPARRLRQPSMPNATVTRARRAKSLSNSDAPTPFLEAASQPKGTRLYCASKLDCDTCRLKPQRCPNALARKIPRDLHEDARDVARAHAATPQYLEACRWAKESARCCSHISKQRILRLARLRLRGPNGAKRRISPCRHRPKPETTFALPKTDQYASRNAGRIAPGVAAQASPTQWPYYQPLSSKT